MGDVDRRQNNGESVSLGEAGHGHDIPRQEVMVDRVDDLKLARLVVDDHEDGILGRKQRIPERVTLDFAGHVLGSCPDF